MKRLPVGVEREGGRGFLIPQEEPEQGLGCEAVFSLKISLIARRTGLGFGEKMQMLMLLFVLGLSTPALVA